MQQAIEDIKTREFTLTRKRLLAILYPFMQPPLPGKMKPLHPDHFIHQGA
jgi:hypothetical protein